VKHQPISLLLIASLALTLAVTTASRIEGAPGLPPASAVAPEAVSAQEPQQPPKTRKKRNVKATVVEPESPASEAAAPPATAAPAAAAPETRPEDPAPRRSEPAAAAPTATSQRSVEQPTASASAASEPPPRAVPGVRETPGLRETVTVREVQLDVLVTDGRGGPVLGLGPSDFVIEEEGERREITSVIYYGGLPELRAAGAEGTERRTDRYFILLFHDQAQAAAPALMAAQLDAGRWTKKWIEEGLEPNDQVAVLGYDVRLKVYEDFTRDRGRILAAIDQAAIGRKEPDRWRQDEAREATVDSPSLLVNLASGKTLSRQTRKLEEALAVIGQAAEGIVGRKNLVLFSIGFGDIDDFGLYTPDPRYYPEMEQSLNTANVAVYAVDMLGAARSSPSQRLLNDSLSSIATDTGGHYYSMFTNVATPLREVANDNLGYYLISYRSDFETGTSGYREVKVETVEGRFKVRAREGYRYGVDS
jgi:VWFA-related protein